MPFASEAQRGYLWVHEPELARRWEHETPKGKDLPEHVAKEAATETAPTPVAATDGLYDQLRNENEYVLRPAVPVFDEHDDLDEQGKVIRRFDRPALAAIAAACNHRERQTGDLCPITLGHTIDGAPESQQPPIVGFARNFRVGPFGPMQKAGILADFYLRKAHYAAAMEHPRRSVELWVKDRLIDPIALLRRTPQRDLGLLTHGRDGRVKLRYALDEAMPSMPTPPVPYQGENFRPPPTETPPTAPRPADVPPIPPTGQQPPPPVFMPDPTMPPDARDPDPEDMEKFLRCLRRYMAAGNAAPPPPPPLPAPALPPAGAGPLQQQGAAGPGFPSATNVSPPQLEDERPERLTMYSKTDIERDSDAVFRMRMENEILRMQKERDADKHKWEQEKQQLLQQLQGQLADERKGREVERLDYAREKSKRIVAQCEYEGYVIPRPHELVDVLAHMDEASRIAKEREIRECFAKAPLGDRVPVAQAHLDSYYGTPPTTEQQRHAAVSLATEKKISYDDALTQVKQRL